MTGASVPGFAASAARRLLPGALALLGGLATGDDGRPSHAADPARPVDKTPLLKAAIPKTFGPGTCKPGFVWREAGPDDRVCVTPAARDAARAQNEQTPRLWVPGPAGPKTCAKGHVRREAFDGDMACVRPAAREQTRRDNELAASRREGG